MSVLCLVVVVLFPFSALADDAADISEERERIASLEEEINQLERKNKTRMIKLSDRVGVAKGLLPPDAVEGFHSHEIRKKVSIPDTVRYTISERLYAPFETVAAFGSIDVPPNGKPTLRSDSKKGHLATVAVFLSPFGRIAFPMSKLLRYTKSGKLSKKQKEDLCQKSPLQIDAEEGTAVFVFNHHPDLSFDRSSPMVFCDSPDVLLIDVNFFEEGSPNHFFETFLAALSPEDIPKGYELSASGDNTNSVPPKDDTCTDDDVCPSEEDVLLSDRISKKRKGVEKVIKAELDAINALEIEIALAEESQRANQTRLTKVIDGVATVNQILSEWELSDLEKRLGEGDDGMVSVANNIRSRISDALHIPDQCLESNAEAELIEDGTVKVRSDPKQGHLFSVYVFTTDEGRLVFPGEKGNQPEICSLPDLTEVKAARGKGAIVYHHNSDLTVNTDTAFALCDTPQLLSIHGNFYKGTVNNFYNTLIKNSKKKLPAGYRMPGSKKKKKKNKKKDS